MPVFNHYNIERDDLPEDAVWIIRPRRWAIPFAIGRDGDRATFHGDVLERAAEWAHNEILRRQEQS